MSDTTKGLSVGDNVTDDVKDTPQKAGQPQVGYPVCPYCASDPAAMVTMPVVFGRMEALVIYCAQESCRKVFAVEVVGIVPEGRAPSSRITPATTIPFNLPRKSS